MTIPSLPQFRVPTPEEIRDGFLRKLAFGADAYGLTVNVLPGSEYHFRGTAMANLVAPAYANEKVAVKALNPIDAIDETLLEIAATHGVFPLLAAAATGQVEVGVVGSGSVIIPDGFLATGPNGVQYQVIGPATVSDGDSVTVIAVKGGTNTNVAPGAKLRWDSASITNLKQTAQVDDGGLTGGTADETEEELRARLLDRLSSPANGGNWSFVRDIAKAASAAVKGAYVYPALQGPGSTSVCIVRNEGDRWLDIPVVNQVAAALIAKVPGHTKWNVTSAQAQYIDMVCSATLNDAPEASGSGGGWFDAVPFPNSSTGPVKVTDTNTSAATLTLNLGSIPASLVTGTRIAVWDWADQRLYRYTVVSATDMGADVDIVVTPGPVKSHTGAYVSADCENLQSYCEQFVEYMETQIGPGEKTSSVALLPRSLRKPTADQEAPAEITSRAAAFITNQFAEVRSFDLTYSYETGTTTTRTAPSLPSATPDPPRILVLKHFAIIKL